MNTLATPAVPYPSVELVSIDAVNGVLVLNWLDTAGARVDSGGRVAHFTPAATVIGIEITGYAKPDAETLIAAITTPAAPVVAVPEEILNWRLRVVAAVHRLKPGITAALGALEEPARTIATEVWYNGNTILRDSPLVAQLAGALGLTSKQFDAFFIQATALPT